VVETGHNFVAYEAKANNGSAERFTVQNGEEQQLLIPVAASGASVAITRISSPRPQ
jgi:hypothetical protein